MKPRVKRLPRLWCALQGLLPLEACLAAQRAELAWPAEETAQALKQERAELRTEAAAKSSTRRSAS